MYKRQALKDAIRGAGVTVVEPWKQMGATPEKLAEEEIDPEIDAVVLAFDKDYGYFEICYATRCLLENKGCELVATNRDFQFPAQKNRKLPGNGAFVAAVAAVVVCRGGAAARLLSGPTSTTRRAG